MLTEKAIAKRLGALEALFSMGLEECRKTRKELGLVEAGAAPSGKRKAVDEKTMQRIVTKRNLTALKKVS